MSGVGQALRDERQHVELARCQHRRRLTRAGHGRLPGPGCRPAPHQAAQGPQQGRGGPARVGPGRAGGAGQGGLLGVLAQAHEFPGWIDELRPLQVPTLLIFDDRDFSPLPDVVEMSSHRNKRAAALASAGRADPTDLHAK
jgi:hypothetical protein